MTGPARITSATITLRKPTPSRPRPIEITARLGRARPMFDTLIARNDPRCRWPSQTPSGIARTIATPIAAPDNARCSTVLSQIRPGLSKMNSIASTKVCTSGPPRPDPGRQAALEQHEQGVGGKRKQHRKQARGHELRLEPALNRVEDRLSEPAHADERGDRGKADRRHGRDPDP